MQNNYNVLFLCTGNSARSIMAEAILNSKGGPRFTAYSAGSHPSGKVRPEAIAQLESVHISTDGLRSKSWNEFTEPHSPKMDFVITVCDNAAKETCPLFQIGGSTGGDAKAATMIRVHWGVPDPPAVQGAPREIERAFREAYTILDRRINLFLSLDVNSLDRTALQKAVEQIGGR
jgi:arsenate reductase